MSAYRTYWRSYGGWQALFLSPYFLLSGVFWAFCKPIWFDQFLETENLINWTEWAFSILPSMVSFSLGALAIFLAFSNERFLKILRQKGSQNSYLLAVTSAFFHFILVQFIALGLTLLVVAFPASWLSGLAFFGFVYSLACGIAAAAALLDMAEILNAAGKLDD